MKLTNILLVSFFNNQIRERSKIMNNITKLNQMVTLGKFQFSRNKITNSIKKIIKLEKFVFNVQNKIKPIQFEINKILNSNILPVEGFDKHINKNVQLTKNGLSWINKLNEQLLNQNLIDEYKKLDTRLNKFMFIFDKLNVLLFFNFLNYFMTTDEEIVFMGQSDFKIIKYNINNRDFYLMLHNQTIIFSNPYSLDTEYYTKMNMNIDDNLVDILLTNSKHQPIISFVNSNYNMKTNELKQPLIQQTNNIVQLKRTNK